MSDKSVEIRTNDGIVLMVNEDTLSERTWRLVNMARKQRAQDPQNPEVAAEAGFEFVQHQVSREQQRDEALKIQKELEEMLKAQDLEIFMVVCFCVLIAGVFACFI